MNDQDQPNENTQESAAELKRLAIIQTSVEDLPSQLEQ